KFDGCVIRQELVRRGNACSCHVHELASYAPPGCPGLRADGHPGNRASVFETRRSTREAALNQERGRLRVSCFMILSFSRCQSLSRAVSRLSCSFLPRPKPKSSLIRPFL